MENWLRFVVYLTSSFSYQIVRKPHKNAGSLTIKTFSNNILYFLQLVKLTKRLLENILVILSLLTKRKTKEIIEFLPEDVHELL